MPKTSAEAKEARRTQILDAAVHCFARTGYYATTIEDVVRETGLSRGALYLYFPSKEALYLAISERWNCGGAVAPAAGQHRLELHRRGSCAGTARGCALERRSRNGILGP